MNLYQIQKDYFILIDMLEQSDGDLTPEMEEALKINKEDFEVKLQNYRAIIKKFQDEIKAAQEEKKRIDAFIKQKNSSIDALKRSVEFALTSRDLRSVDLGLGRKFSFKPSVSVGILDEDAIPAKWITTKTTSAPNKIAIKKALQAGEEIKGVELVEKDNLQIK